VTLRVKRVYEPAARGDGYRVLVDRLWPRGLRKEDLALDEWPKDLAPSTELRQWFHHEPERWAEFQRRYLAELKASPATGSLRALAERTAAGPVTLLFSAHDTQHNNAVVLKGELERLARGRGGPRRPAVKRSRSPSARRRVA
jgi:uncharacterized protein YeaO (DUF488 family)